MLCVLKPELARSNAGIRLLREVSLYLRDTGVDNQSTGVFLASAEPTLIASIVSRLPDQFPTVSFTCMSPEVYRESICFPGSMVTFQDVKQSPLQWLRVLRRRRFDVCVAVFGGGPSFRKWKLIPFLLNARQIFIYNENGESFVVGWRQRKNLYRHLKLRRGQWPNSGWLFIPFGFCYLLIRTAMIVWGTPLRSYDSSSRKSQPGVHE
jgi:hypothetical protein